MPTVPVRGMVSHSIGRDPPSPHAKRVDWAEDSVEDQYLIRHALDELHGAEVRFFEDGQALLDGLADRLPDLVVLDIRMPRMGGMEALRAIRRDPRFAGLPVTMFSTAKIEHELAECAALGVRAYVQKPTAFADFTAAVQRVLASAALVPGPPSAS